MVYIPCLAARMPERAAMTSPDRGLRRPARPKARIHVTADLGAGVEVTATGDQAHYLGHVMRLGPGMPVALFNGRDGEWRAHVAGLTRGAMRLAVDTRLRPQTPEPDVWLVFAPIKRARLDFLAEKATELGASALVPVLTHRTVVGRVNLDRLAATAREAAEQTERLSLPVVHAPRALDDVIAKWPEDRRLLVCDESGGGTPIVETLGALVGATGSWAVLTGPEGGFEADELARLRAMPAALPVGLGPRLLRADTAALAALACWQAVLGDWRRPPRAA
jgi:16S rRNA (uracil1498-N3)-methyltransferase